MTSRLWELALARGGLNELDATARRLELRELAIRSGCADPGDSVREVADALDGTGPLTRLMEDAEVTDVLVNGPDEVWVERGGDLIKTQVRFASRHELELLIERLLGRAQARADASAPIADVRLPDGSRLHVVMTSVAPHGPLLSIRRHVAALNLEDLCSRGSISVAQKDLLRDLVGSGACLLISGATGTGKTTLLSALLSEAPATDRIVTIEETPELKPRHPHVVSLVARSANVEGRGEVPITTLARAALRMRPTRIVVGEARGREARVALRAMTTGHRGSMLTIHASDVASAIERFISLCSEGDDAAVRRSVAASVDGVIQLERRERRRIVSDIVLR